MLADFLRDLLEKGHVTVENEVITFDKKDIDDSIVILKKYYNEDKLEMPYKAPEFLASAAIWSAKYLYHSAQLLMLRNLDDNVVNELLQDYPDEINPQSIYSVDLCMRHLPELYNLVKGLAPDDILVKCLEKTAILWAFSSVGMELKEPVNSEIIFTDKSLSQSYIDRIINNNDTKRLSDEKILRKVEEVLGNYPELLWNNFKYINKEKKYE